MPVPSRRDFLAALPAAALAQSAAPGERVRVCVFSKHFHWTDCKEMAGMAAAIGFDGIDLTVREGGHVEPERVAAELPRAVETIRAAGLEAPMITAGIVDTESPHAEAIVKTAAALGIRYYRWGGFRYRDGGNITGQLEGLKPRVKALADLNRQYKVCAMYHTHSGVGQVGASIWDLWWLLKDFDPHAVGFNLDIGHATVEGGFGGWIHSTRLAAPWLRGTAIKDFRWGQNARGEWAPQWCGLGEGMVNFRRYFAMLKQIGFHGPLQLHFEYPELGDAHAGRKVSSIPKEKFVSILHRDLDRLKGWLREAQLIG